jgi:hypothetical protein
MREIHYYDNNKKTVELIDYELELDDDHLSVQVQTDDACIVNFTHIPHKYRNTQFEREVCRYLERAKRLSINVENEENGEDIMSRTAPSFKMKNTLKKGLRKNNLSDSLQEGQDLRNKSLPGSFYNSDRSKQSTTRINFRPLQGRSSREATIRKKGKNSRDNIWEIK